MKMMGRTCIHCLTGIMIVLLSSVLLAGCQTPATAPAPSDQLAMPYLEDRAMRQWNFASGSSAEAAYDSYHTNTVTLVLAEDNRRIDVSLHELSARDQAYVQDMLAKPHGEIDKVTFINWRENRPVFRISATYDPRGTVTFSPIVNLYYLVKDPNTGLIKHACEQIRIYPTKGKLPLSQLPPNQSFEITGANEPDTSQLRIMAHRAVLLLPVEFPAGYRVLDTFIEQNDGTLKTAGAPTDWWRPKYKPGPLTAAPSAKEAP